MKELLEMKEMRKRKNVEKELKVEKKKIKKSGEFDLYVHMAAISSKNERNKGGPAAPTEIRK